MCELEATAPPEHRAMPPEPLLWTAGGISVMPILAALKNLFSCERLFLTADDASERTEGIIHGTGVGKNFGHIRLQNHHVRAALVAPGVFATDAAGEIVFRPQAVAG